MGRLHGDDDNQCPQGDNTVVSGEVGHIKGSLKTFRAQLRGDLAPPSESEGCLKVWL